MEKNMTIIRWGFKNSKVSGTSFLSSHRIYLWPRTVF